jgi:hypothetical protein
LSLTHTQPIRQAVRDAEPSSFRPYRRLTEADRVANRLRAERSRILEVIAYGTKLRLARGSLPLTELAGLSEILGDAVAVIESAAV